jgi:hypothetical protein
VQVIKHLTDEKAQVHELPRKKGKAAAEHALDSAMEAVEQAERKDRQADQAGAGVYRVGLVLTRRL